MNKYLEIIILHVCYLLLRAYSLFRLVLNYDVMSTDIEELTWQHKDMNVHHWFWLYCHMQGCQNKPATGAFHWLF